MTIDQQTVWNIVADPDHRDGGKSLTTMYKEVKRKGLTLRRFHDQLKPMIDDGRVEMVRRQTDAGSVFVYIKTQREGATS